MLTKDQRAWTESCDKFWILAEEIQEYGGPIVFQTTFLLYFEVPLVEGWYFVHYTSGRIWDVWPPEGVFTLVSEWVLSETRETTIITDLIALPVRF